MILPKTTDDLINRFRSDVGDPLEGVSTTDADSENLWKNWELYEYMTEAADAVARGTQSIYKTFVLPVVVDEAEVSLPASVRRIRMARLVAQAVVLDDINQKQLALGYTRDYGFLIQNGSFTMKGRPSGYVRDRLRNKLVLTPIPTVADTLELQCTVTINADLSCGMPLPFTELPDVRLMLQYMKYLAYRKQDADVTDLTKSNDFFAEFENGVVNRELEVRRERRLPSPIQMDGW